MSNRTLRIAGTALALVAGAVHLVLSQANLITGETTATPAFLAMGLGFLGCAALLTFATGDLLIVAPVYSLALVLAYFFTRGEYPLELWGILSKLAEIGLAAVAVVLFRRSGESTEVA